MISVQFDPAAEFCVTDSGRRDMLENLERYRASLDRCRATLMRANEAAR